MGSPRTGSRPSVAVVGAGLSGLTAAYRLHAAGWRVRVFESEPVVGGRTVSARMGEFLVDRGASALGATYAAYLGLTEELGLRDDVVACSPYIGIYRDGRIHHLRTDRLVRSGLTTRLLSPRAKLRAARLGADVARAVRAGWLDYADLSKSAPLDTETARAYALRALGPELDAYLCEPVTRTMLIADTGTVSKVELFSGIANILTTRIHALLGGQGRLATTLAAGLDVTLNAPVELIRDTGTGIDVHYRKITVSGAGSAISGPPTSHSTNFPTYAGTAGAEPAVEGGTVGVVVERFDACVVSAPLPVAAAICPDRAALLGPLNDVLGYTQAITVAVGTSAVPRSPAMLVQLPSREDPDIALMFLEHHKAPDRAPPGHGLIGCDWETGAATRWMNRTDDEIVEHTLASVYRVFPELAGTVVATEVTRWPRALPLTSVGAYRAIGALTAALDPADRIQFAADYLSAAGQNTAVEFGTLAARNLLTHAPTPATR